jgi:hypothetical protein
MRLAVYMQYSNWVNLQACSVFNMTKDFLALALDQDEDLFVFLPFPKGFEFKGDSTRPIDSDRVKPVEVFALRDQYFELSALSDWHVLFDVNEGTFTIDAVMTNRSPTSTFLKNVVGGRFGRAPIINWVTFLYSPKNVKDSMLAAQALGLATSFNIFTMKGVYLRGLELARRYLAPSLVKQFTENSVVIQDGINCDLVDSIREGAVRHEQKTMIYCWRAVSSEQTKRIIRLYDTLYCTGRDVKILFGQVSGNNPRLLTTKWWERYSHLDRFKGLGREEYLKEAAKAHAFAAVFPEHTEFSKTVFELLYLGLVGVFRRGDNFVKFLPEGYPFLFSDDAQCFAILTEICENWDSPKIQGWVGKTRQWIKANYDNKVNYSKMWGLAQEYIEKEQATGKNLARLTELVRKSSEPLDAQFTFKQLAEACSANADRRTTFVDEGVFGNKNALYRVGRELFRVLPQEDLVFAKRG